MAEAHQHIQQPHRPFSVTLVLVGVLLLGLANGWRALGLFRQSGLLLELNAEPDPRLCAAISIAWALLFLGLAYALWRRKSYTRVIAPLALLIFGLFQFVLASPCTPENQIQNGLRFDGIVYGAAVLLATLTLNLASGREYFRA